MYTVDMTKGFILYIYGIVRQSRYTYGKYGKVTHNILMTLQLSY